jgi:hypothetical protein
MAPAVTSPIIDPGASLLFPIDGSHAASTRARVQRLFPNPASAVEKGGKLDIPNVRIFFPPLCCGRLRVLLAKLNPIIRILLNETGKALYCLKETNFHQVHFGTTNQ